MTFNNDENILFDPEEFLSTWKKLREWWKNTEDIPKQVEFWKDEINKIINILEL